MVINLLYALSCSEFIAGLFPDNIEKLARGRPTTASVKIKVCYILVFLIEISVHKKLKSPLEWAAYQVMCF